MCANLVNPNYKLSVDTYEQVNDKLICQCFTPGLTGEESYIPKEVSIEELQVFLNVNKGSIESTLFGDSENTEPVDFWYWFGENNNSVEMLDILSDLINKREGRKQLADMPDILKPLQSILNGYKKERRA